LPRRTGGPTPGSASSDSVPPSGLGRAVSALPGCASNEARMTGRGPLAARNDAPFGDFGRSGFHVKQRPGSSPRADGARMMFHVKRTILRGSRSARLTLAPPPEPEAEADSEPESEPPEHAQPVPVA